MGLLEKKIISLDIDEGAVAAAEMVVKPKGVALSRFAVLSSPQEAKDKFIKGKDTDVSISLPTQAVLFRTFHMASALLRSKNKDKEIASFLEHQNLPFKLEECFWDTFIWDSTLIFVAAKTEILQKYIAQLQDLKLRVLGITASQVALYNVFIYNYPQEKEKFALLNIRNSSSDILIYENKRVFIYPLSLGKQDIQETIDKKEDKKERFALEAQRIFNTHYLQYPMIDTKTPNRLYLAGRDSSYGLLFALKRAMGDFEVKALEASRNIDCSGCGAIENPEQFALTCGTALGQLKAAGCVTINLFKARLKEKERALNISFAKSAAVFGGVFLFLALLVVYIGLFKDFEKYIFLYNTTEYQVSQQLPEVKDFKARKESLQKLKGYLEKTLEEERLYHLKALAAISESRPSSVTVSNFLAQMIRENEPKRRDLAASSAALAPSAKPKIISIPSGKMKLQVFLSGNGSTYEDISVFLANLKRNKEVKEVKIVASTFPTFGNEEKAIEFKLGFEISDESAGQKRGSRR